MKKSFDDYELEKEEAIKESTKQAYSPEELMCSFQKGDENAFQELYETFKRPLYFFIRGLTSRHGEPQAELSEELTHEAFLKLYKNKDQFNFSVKFTTWFWTIARNLTVDELRKNNPLDWSIDNSPNEWGDPIEGIADERLEVESLIFLKVQREELYLAIEGLRPRQREVIMLRVASELSFEEIATVMDLKTNAVKALFMRAKNNLEKTIHAQHNQKVAT